MAEKHFQVTTERVLRMVPNAAKKNEFSRSVVRQNPSSKNTNVLSDTGVPTASRERHRMELLKVKKAEIDPNKRASLEQELIKDYPENGTVEIVNWEGTFAPIIGDPYVAPLHHQPDEFWDAIYTSKSPDLPTPPGADISGETTVHPLFSPRVQKNRLPSMVNHQQNPNDHQLNPNSFGPNHQSDHQLDIKHPLINRIEAKEKNKGQKDKNEKKKPKLTIKEKRKKKKEKRENPNNSLKTAARITMAGMNQDGRMDEAQVHPQISVATPNFPGKTEQHLEHIPIKVSAKEKSEENLKTPSEEERESGTTYKPEGAYEYPSFRHPDFNPDTAYDEHGIPIHESPGWTPPPTLPGDNRFGKGRKQAGAGMRSGVNGPLPVPQVAKNGRQNYHGLQDHLALMEHQQAVEGVHGLYFAPVHPTESHAHVNLPLLNKEGLGMDNVNHRIKKRKASTSGSSESFEPLSKIVDSEDSKTAQDQETAQEKAYKLTETELNNKEDSAPLEALNPALYSHRNMFQVKKKTQKAKVNIGELPLDKLPINFNKLAKSSAEVIAVIVSGQDGSVPKCHIHSKLKPGELPPLPVSSPEVTEVYSKKNKNEGRNPILYKKRNMLKISDLKDDDFRINEDLIRQLIQINVERTQKKQAVRLEECMKGPQGHTLKGRGRENFNPIFLNERKLLHVKTSRFEEESRENLIAKREVGESLNPALYSFQNLFSGNPKQVLPLEKNGLSPLQMEASNGVPNLNTPLLGGRIPIIDEDSDEKKLHSSAKQYDGKNKEAMNPFLVNYRNMFKVNFDLPPSQMDSMKKTDKTLKEDLTAYKGRKKEILNPLFGQYQNMFSAADENTMKKSRKEIEALNPHLLHLTNAFGVNYNKLNRVPLEKVQINPMFINNQKGYTEREKNAVLSRFNNLFASAAARRVNNKGNHQLQTDKNQRTNEQMSNIERVRRHIEETENKQHRDPEMLGRTKEHNFKTKNEHSIGLGTPGAGRPKSFKRKSKDSEDSFASYFDGVDHNIVEDDESTPPPERTTMALFEVDPFEFMTTRRASGNRTYNRGVRHTPSTMSSLPNVNRWQRWDSGEQYPRVFTRPPPDSEADQLEVLEASESIFLVDDKDDDEEPLLVVSRRPRFFLTEPTEAPLSTPWSENCRRWKNRPENHFLHKHTQQTMWDGWRKLGILEDRRRKKDLEEHWNKLVQEEKEFQKELKERLKKRKALRELTSVRLDKNLDIGNDTIQQMEFTTAFPAFDSVLERNDANR